MIRSSRTTPLSNSNNPLLKNIQTKPGQSKLAENIHQLKNNDKRYNVKVCLESIHYTGENYGYGWNFVVSILNKHWISHRIQIQRGTKSLVNKDVYKDITNTTLESLKNLEVAICAQHRSGFKIESILHLQPNSFKEDPSPKSIYTHIGHSGKVYSFHELQTVTHEDAQLMFVFNFEISPIDLH